MRSLYYKRDGTSYSDLMEWAKEFETSDRIVKQTELPNGIYVSTVFLGIDHNWGDGEPLIFETMAFKRKDDFSELDMIRYHTEKEAELGHEQMCKKMSEVKIDTKEGHRNG